MIRFRGLVNTEKVPGSIPGGTTLFARFRGLLLFAKE